MDFLHKNSQIWDLSITYKGGHMKILDKMAFNRLVAIIANFVLNVIKLFAPKAVEDIEVPEVTPDRRKIFPIFRRKKKDENSN